MFPIKKKFKKEIIDEKWNKLAEVNYWQASIYEWYEFVQSPNQNIIIMKLIEQNIKFFCKDRHKDDVRASLISDGFLSELIDTRFKTYKSIYKGKWRPAIDQANIVFVAKELNIEPQKLLHNYTMEEFGRLLDGLVWNANEWSKEWKLKNDTAKLSTDWKAKEKQKHFQNMFDQLDVLDKNK